MAERRIALVSGANRGLGREIARQLAEDHGHLAIVGARDAEAADRTAAELGGDAIGVQLDVSDQASVDAARARIESDPGRLDVLVNNAGVAGAGYSASAADVDLDAVKETLETNLFGAWRLAQAMVPLLRRSGHGRIVNMSSGMGQLSDMNGGSSDYRVSKTGLNVLTRVLAEEEGPNGILVNSLCPGWVRTDMGGSGARESVEDGADTAVWLATLPDGGPTGGFFRKREPIPW